jgi:hypothetical protein
MVNRKDERNVRCDGRNLLFTDIIPAPLFISSPSSTASVFFPLLYSTTTQLTTDQSEDGNHQRISSNSEKYSDSSSDKERWQ